MYLSRVNSFEKEVADRLRRIETRLTKYLEAQGFDTQAQKARWNPREQAVEIPSRAIALKEILDCIPITHIGQEVNLTIEGETIGAIWKD